MSLSKWTEPARTEEIPKRMATTKATNESFHIRELLPVIFNCGHFGFVSASATACSVTDAGR